VACTLEHALAEHKKVTALLDGDNIRHGLNSNVGFSAADREENIRRIGEVSKLFADTGIITLVSFISPYKKDRDRVRSRVQPGQFIEVLMKVPIEICEERDPKGLYKKVCGGQTPAYVTHVRAQTHTRMHSETHTSTPKSNTRAQIGALSLAHVCFVWRFPSNS
jgi:adenylylsulfate kinase